jgi:3'-phosphoadenosine 5'-phosphosulfate sulfotransferase (PAPS reductase)/FAD synthetase
MSGRESLFASIPHEQTVLLPRVDPDELIDRAKIAHEPVATVCLFSGGHDSTVLAHRCRDHYEALAFIDTGTAIPGVREFVESYAEWLGKPLRILESGDAYRRLVLGLHKENPPPEWRPYGFPGPAGHNRAYNQIKERQLRKLRADLQDGHRRGARVLMLSGIRRAESQRRKGRPEISFHGSIVFANPLIDWTAREMLAYRHDHGLPESEVAALLHRSGECNCGSFAAPGEREQLQALWPEWFDETIASLEREAEAAGIGSCRWGERTVIDSADTPEDGLQLWNEQPLCADCPAPLPASAPAEKETR